MFVPGRVQRRVRSTTTLSRSWSDLIYLAPVARPKVASSLAPSPFLTRLFRLTDIKRTHRSPLFDSATIR